MPRLPNGGRRLPIPPGRGERIGWIDVRRRVKQTCRAGTASNVSLVAAQVTYARSAVGVSVVPAIRGPFRVDREEIGMTVERKPWSTLRGRGLGVQARAPARICRNPRLPGRLPDVMPSAVRCALVNRNESSARSQRTYTLSDTPRPRFDTQVTLKPTLESDPLRRYGAVGQQGGSTEHNLRSHLGPVPRHVEFIDARPNSRRAALEPDTGSFGPRTGVETPICVRSGVPRADTPSVRRSVRSLGVARPVHKRRRALARRVRPKCTFHRRRTQATRLGGLRRLPAGSISEPLAH